MPRKKIYQRNLSFFNNKRLQFEDLPQKTMKVTIYALKWVFLLIFLFIIVGIMALLISGGTENVQMIVSYSITGFFTFFMGYFGWILAQGIIDMITGKKEKSDHAYSFYFRKHNRYKF